MDCFFTIANFAKVYEANGEMIYDKNALSIQKLQKIIHDFPIAFKPPVVSEVKAILGKFHTIVLDEIIQDHVLKLIKKVFSSIKILDLQITDYNPSKLTSSFAVDLVFRSTGFNKKNFLKFYSVAPDGLVLNASVLQIDFLKIKKIYGELKAKIFLNDVLDCFSSVSLNNLNFLWILPEIIQLGKQFENVLFNHFKLEDSGHKKIVVDFLNSQKRLKNLKILEISFNKCAQIDFSNCRTLDQIDFSQAKEIKEIDLVHMIENLSNCRTILLPKIDNKFLLNHIHDSCPNLISIGFKEPASSLIKHYFSKWIKKMDGKIKNITISDEQKLEFTNPKEVYSVETLKIINCKFANQFSIFTLLNAFPNLLFLRLVNTDLTCNVFELFTNNMKYKRITMTIESKV